MKLKVFVLVMLILVLTLVGCNGSQGSSAEVGGDAGAQEGSTTSGTNATGTDEWPEKFVVGFFGGDDVNDVIAQNQPFADYLKEKLGIEVEIFTGTSYTAVVEAMRADRVDAMLVGPFAYTLAVQEAQAEAVAVSISSTADEPVYDPTLPAHYYSVIFTKKGSGIQTLDDLRGRSFNFVDPASTSGHLMPRTLLVKNGVDPDDPANNMTTVFAGSHPTSVLSVWNDKADAGATYEGNIYTLWREGQIDFCGFEDEKLGLPRTAEEIQAVYDACPDESLVIIAYSDPIPNTPFAVRTELPQSFKDAVREALLDIKNNPEMIAQTNRWFVDPSEELGYDFLDQYYNPLRDLATLLDLDLKELADPKSVWPEKLVVGFFAGDDANEVLSRNQPFADYLSEELGIEVELFTGTSYTAVIEAMRAKRVDAMQVGPFSYVLAVQEAGAEALGVSVYSREETPVFDETLQPYYYSVIFTKKGSGLETLDDLKGKDFNFVDPASTSGYLMPRTTLIKYGIDPEDPANEITTVFAGSHPTSVLSVWNDKADAGATFETNLYTLRDEGQIEFCGFLDEKTGISRTPEEIQAVYDACPDGSIVILAYTDPIPSTPFAVRSDLPRSLKLEIRRLILEIKDNPELIAQTGFWYLDPSPEFGFSQLDPFYNSLRDVAKLLNLDLTALEQ